MGHFEVASGTAGIISGIAVEVWIERKRDTDREWSQRGGTALPSAGTQ